MSSPEMAHRRSSGSGQGARSAHDALAELEARLGVSFADKSLLQRALVHRSYLNEHPGFPLEDNERLEFLGDAVLSFVTGEYLYHRFPELDEGRLTNLRAALVRRQALARVGRQLGLGQVLLMGAGEAATGGRERPAALCGAFEALVGALYLDQGLDVVKSFLAEHLDLESARVIREQADRDAKSRLQEYAQSELHHTPRYITVSESGPDHAKQFVVEVAIGGTPFGQGSGASKQEAAQAAAHSALARLQREGRAGVPAGPWSEAPPDKGANGGPSEDQPLGPQTDALPAPRQGSLPSDPGGPFEA